MYSIASVISRIKNRFTVPKVILGRWSNEDCIIKTRTKTDFANEDHCSCDDYLRRKRLELQEREKKITQL